MPDGSLGRDVDIDGDASLALALALSMAEPGAGEVDEEALDSVLRESEASGAAAPPSVTIARAAPIALAGGARGAGRPVLLRHDVAAHRHPRGHGC